MLDKLEGYKNKLFLTNNYNYSVEKTVVKNCSYSAVVVVQLPHPLPRYGND